MVTGCTAAGAGGGEVLADCEGVVVVAATDDDGDGARSGAAAVLHCSKQALTVVSTTSVAIGRQTLMAQPYRFPEARPLLRLPQDGGFDPLAGISQI